MKFLKKHKDIKKGKDLHPTTVMVNNVQKEKSREAVRHVLTWLSSTFPKAFNVEGTIRPLKIGVFQDILAYAEQHDGLPCSKAKLRKALVVFTRRMEYLTCVKMRDTRIDLNGDEVESVSEEGAQLAVQRIKKTIEKTIRSQRKSPSSRQNTERSYRSAAPQKRRFSSPHHGNYNPYHEHSPREQQSAYHHDADEPSSPATIKVKRRYTPKHQEGNNSYHSGKEHAYKSSQPEKNYNSESYNTSLSTVDRLKAKLGITRRKESFNYDE